MSHEQLKKYITQLNSGERNEVISSRPIGENVDLLKILPKEENEKGSNLPPYTIFFIKNSAKDYIGAVLDMYIDLQWYILEDDRGRGHLTKALREAILPFIFSDSRKYKRETQEITLDGDFYEESKRVAESIGFKQTDVSTKTTPKFELTKVDFERS